MRNCRGIAERYAEGALANYRRDGELAPAIIILDHDQHSVVQAIPVLSPELHGMPGAIYTIGSMLCPLFTGRWVIAISETWTTVLPDTVDHGILRRGELEERALGGDQTVGTALLVAVYDLQDLPDSHTLLYSVDQSFQRTDIEGPGTGEMADAVGQLAEVVADSPMPPSPPPTEIVAFVGVLLQDYIQALMVPKEADHE